MSIVAFFILIFSLSASAGSEDAILVAEHSGDCGTWQVEFYKSGYAHETLEENCGDKEDSFHRLHRIVSKDLEIIEKVVQEVQFDRLPDSIDPKTYVADEDYYIITIGKKSVFGMGLDRSIDADHASRFGKVWQEINKIIKEPE